MDLYIIMERKSKYTTIGMVFRDLWKENIHSEKGNKIFNSEIGKWECKNFFPKFITINQNLKLNHIISSSYKMTGKRICLLKFYETKKSNPISSFEKRIELIGEWELDAGKDYNNIEERELIVKLKFGGAFIDVKANHLKSGKNINAKFNFS